MSSNVLIIASYNGPRHPTISPTRMLEIQYDQLQKLEHNTDVIIVVNKARYDANYEKALTRFPVVIERENHQGSYGAWKDGFLLTPKYEWYFFLEDDYTFALDNFDQKMIEMWKPGTSYLAERVFDAVALKHKHASISNGLSRYEILNKIDWSQLIDASQYDSHLQMGWSGLFAMDGLADITEKYSTPFWNGEYIKYWEDEEKPALIVPMQML